MSCHGTRIVHTIGHSTRPIETLLTLLRTHAITLLVDVRRWPMSRRHPQFKRETLAAALQENRIEYLWRGDLGGFRKPGPNSPNTAWRVSAFRAYADYMLTAEFESIMVELERIAAKRRISLMCAEALPWQCHRQLLADAFLVRGWHVATFSMTLAGSTNCRRSLLSEERGSSMPGAPQQRRGKTANCFDGDAPRYRQTAG